MAIVQIDPQSGKSPYLKVGGIYGNGQDNEADVEITELIWPCEPGDGPGYDRQCERDDYALWRFRVKHNEFGLMNLREWQSLGPNTGSKNETWLRNLDIQLFENQDEGGNPVFQVDLDAVPGTKCAIRVGDPKKLDDGRVFTGNVYEVISI